jgi:hypothetical protein
MPDNIDAIRDALEQARQSLHDTVAEVKQKVAKRLSSGYLMRRHLSKAAFLAGALGFAAGMIPNDPAKNYGEEEYSKGWLVYFSTVS